MKKKEIPNEDMDKVISTLVLAVKVINPEITDEGAINLLKNVGIYLIRKD
jgi:hypothetical protein